MKVNRKKNKSNVKRELKKATKFVRVAEVYIVVGISIWDYLRKIRDGTDRSSRRDFSDFKKISLKSWRKFVWFPQKVHFFEKTVLQSFWPKKMIWNIKTKFFVLFRMKYKLPISKSMLTFWISGAVTRNKYALLHCLNRIILMYYIVKCWCINMELTWGCINEIYCIPLL